MDDLDLQLVRRIAARDEIAFASFYDRHAPRVLALLQRLLPSRIDAEDVLQETFWQIWRQADRYEASRSSPQGWLLLLARSRAIDHLRRRQPPAIRELDNEVSSDCVAPWMKILRDELREEVNSALNDLPEEQRTALCLSFYAGWTHEETAQRLQLPLGTVKTRIRLAMQRLRKSLSGTREASAP